MISGLEAGGSRDPRFIKLNIPAAELFMFLGAPLAKSIFINNA